MKLLVIDCGRINRDGSLLMNDTEMNQMITNQNIKKYLLLSAGLIRHNLKIIFANKFIYFLSGAVFLYFLILILGMLNDNSVVDEGQVYNMMMLPGLLLIFYPMTFGIYNDMEAGMMEMLIGIPNYRYKVWLVRLAIIWALVFLLLSALSFLTAFLVSEVEIFDMAVQLMYPVFFFGAAAFLTASFVKNGNGSAALMVLIGMVFWIWSGILGENRWNIFLNPYDQPADISDNIWLDMIYYNRIFLVCGIILALLGALYRLQKREKFV